ncbi:uncharacterized protein LOC126794905 [Argentina anserina]|uniref:uncharacterized protein LOC126794905 n=1 Tax=Argentina anserina TaxID=57926 RepID=UPI0021761EBD|nr:uncharacterized protein LOC126794905 [Potentilla anserina]
MEVATVSEDKKHSSSQSGEEMDSRHPRPLLIRRKSMELVVSGSKEPLPSGSRQEFGSSSPRSLMDQKKVIEVRVSGGGKKSLPSHPRLEVDSRLRPKSMELRSSDRKEHLLSQPRREVEPSEVKSSRRVWDCGSSLYDSFELNSFKRELDSAISCRTMSMPHLSDRRAPLPKQPQPAVVAKKPSKFSRSINKLLRSVFKPKTSSGPVFRLEEQSKKTRDGFHVVYDKSGALTTIPEVVPHECSGFSPEIGSLVRRTGSERFTSTASIGISCA